MSWPKKAIEISFILLLILVPLIFLPFTSELFEFNKMIVVYLLAVLIAAFWISRMILENRLIFRRTALDLPVLIFLISQSLSYFFSIDPRTSLLGYYSRFNGGLASLLSYALLYWAAVSNLDRKSSLNLLSWSVGLAGVVAGWGFLEHFGIDDPMWVQDVAHRVFSTLGQPNWLAAYLVALIFIHISMILSSGSKIQSAKSILLFSFTLLLFITLLFTKSRSVLLAFGVSSAVFWGYILLRHFQTHLKFLLSLNLVFIIIAISIRNPVQDIVFSRQPALPSASAPVQPALESGGTESGAIRQIVWKGAIDIWRASDKNFWLGAGPETFAMAYYNHRPVEHNYTSEWELLYNKAHNEFLNFLATTGLIGLGSYILLLLAMAWVFIKQLKIVKLDNTLEIGHWKLVIPALCAGWLSLSVTNYWGFSVVITQIFLFIFPALALTLTTNPATHSALPATTSNSRLFSIMLLFLPALYLSYSILRYWTADIKYASGQNNFRAFILTQDLAYIVKAYDDLASAYSLNHKDPPIASEFSTAAAYMSLLSYDSKPETARQLADLSQSLSRQAVAASPYHPNYLKSRGRSLLLLAVYDTSYYPQVEATLEQAARVSPTDPRIPQMQALVARYKEDYPTARRYLEKALALKPDFADALASMSEIATLSATPESP